MKLCESWLVRRQAVRVGAQFTNNLTVLFVLHTPTRFRLQIDIDNIKESITLSLYQ